MTKRGRTHGSHAVVTGAGSGIGRAIARELARRGGRVVCADLDLATAKDTVTMIEAADGAALAVECDVSVEQQVAELADAAEQWFDAPVDLVVNNAGVGAGGQMVGETPLPDWRRVLDVNLWGVLYGCHIFAPRLRAAGRGGVINIASAASFAAAPGMGAYNVSKAAVLALSETMAAELSGTGVEVTVVCPTFVKTNILSHDLINAAAARIGTALTRLAGMSADRLARTVLDAHDRGRLYVVPQLNAQLVWRLKRLLPVPYTRALGLAGRFAPRNAQ